MNIMDEEQFFISTEHVGVFRHVAHVYSSHCMHPDGYLFTVKGWTHSLTLWGVQYMIKKIRKKKIREARDNRRSLTMTMHSDGTIRVDDTTPGQRDSDG